MKCMQFFLSRDIKTCRPMFAFEKDKECQMELQMSDDHPLHLFGNIMCCVNPQVRALLEQNAERMDFETLTRISKRENIIIDSLSCVQHVGR